MAIDYTTPRFPVRVAARAAGYAANTLRALYQRGRFRVVGGVEAKKQGLAAMLNLRDVMHIAVAKRLMDLGVEPADAFQATISFSHIGNDKRDPAHLFDQREDGHTILVYYSASRSARLYASNDGLDFTQLFFDPGTGARCASIAVLLNDVEREVFSALQIRGDE